MPFCSLRVAKDLWVKSGETSRWASHIPLRVRFAGGVMRAARLIDLAPTRCRIQCLAVRQAGTRVFLHIDQLTPVNGSVVWAKDMFAEIAFDSGLDTAILNHLLPWDAAVEDDVILEMRDIAERCSVFLTRGDCVDVAPHLSSLARDCRAQATTARLERAFGR
jgi:hypothetical protein